MTSLRLVPYAEEHLAAAQALLDDPEVLRWTPIPEPVHPEHSRRWLGVPAWAVLDGDVLVAVGLAPVADRERAEFELGYLVAREHRGRGVATWVLRALTRWALDEGAERVALHISVGNTASRRVAERCGYELEGVLRNTYLKAGRRDDTAVYAVYGTELGVRTGC